MALQTRRIALIGGGGMARDFAALVRRLGESGIALVGAMELPSRRDEAKAALGIPVVDNLSDLLALEPDLVAELAGQQAVHAYGAAVLNACRDLLLISSGSLADRILFDHLRNAAALSRRRILIPAGAIGGIDAIVAMRLSGIESVRYRAVKPPFAWRATPAEEILDLERLTKRTPFYSGTAREAAARFPQNANVTATLALAGIGFDRTEVELVADPAAQRNFHEIEVSSKAGEIAIRMAGYPSAANPKTSALAAFSVARALLNETNAVII
jgi:aspartate dehydrogenase